MDIGIDIASHQHPRGVPINYAAVAQQIKFVSIKATEYRLTDHYRNPFFPGDYWGFRDAGVLTGAYMWFTPFNGVEQADFFCDYVGKLNSGDLRPMIDVEEEGVDGAELLACARRIETRLGITPFLYGGANPRYNKPLIQCVQQTPELSSFPLWVASYGFSLDHGPGEIGPWDHWCVWQQTSSGNIEGISALVDLDYTNELSYHQYLTMTPPVDIPTPEEKLKPMYDGLTIDVVASCPGPHGQGALLLGRDGGVFMFHCSIPVPAGFIFSPVGQDFWAGREGAEIALNYSANGVWDGTFTITATTGETYTFPVAV